MICTRAVAHMDAFQTTLIVIVSPRWQASAYEVVGFDFV